MKNLFSIVSFVILIFLLGSCSSKNKIDKEVKEFVNARINLPLDSMVSFSAKGPWEILGKATYIYVMYIDSTSCSDCAISHLSDWAQLDIVEHHNLLKYAFIIAPKRSQYYHISAKIDKDFIFKEYVFLDTLGIFERSNPMLPSNKLLHTFMIDRQKKVRLVGNPTSNRRIIGLLSKFLKQGAKNNE